MTDERLAEIEEDIAELQKVRPASPAMVFDINLILDDLVLELLNEVKRLREAQKGLHCQLPARR